MSPRPPRSTLDMGTAFDEHFDYLFSALRRLGVREADLEDLVHEVFLKVHVRRADYDPERPLRPWLFGFAYRVAADYRRLARNRVEVLMTPVDIAQGASTADQHIEAQERQALVRRALAAVEVDRRAVLILHDLDGIAVPEIAQALEIPLNTAYSRLRLARDELASALRRLRKAGGEP